MGFPAAIQSSNIKVIYTTAQTTLNINGGWSSGSLSATWSNSENSFLSVYVMGSGAAAPLNARLVDVTAYPVSIATLVLPAAGSGSLNMIGPGISGTNVTNQLGYFNVIVPANVRLQIDSGAASWYKVIVVGR